MKMQEIKQKQNELIELFEQIEKLENECIDISNGKNSLFEQLGQTFNPMNEFPFTPPTLKEKVDKIVEIQKIIGQFENKYCKKLHEIYELAKQ